MQSVSSRIWTCVAVSISYDDNHYNMGASKNYDSNIAILSGDMLFKTIGICVIERGLYLFSPMIQETRVQSQVESYQKL